jgi:hypothetical protein
MMSLAPAPADLGYEARADAARAHMRMRSQQRSAGLQLHSAEQRVMHQYALELRQGRRHARDEVSASRGRGDDPRPLLAH